MDFGGVEEANESGDVKKEELVIVPVADANVTAVKPKDQGGLKGAGVDLSGADCGAGYY